MMLTADRLRELVDYNPETGVFTRRIRTSNRINAGDKCGSVNSEGYLVFRVDGKLHKAHRLAFLYVHGRWPVGETDHINGDRSDNKIANLREASNAQNQANAIIRSDNRSGVKGVGYCKKMKQWRARIRKDGVRYELGFFASVEAAANAYEVASKETHGDFSVLMRGRR